MRQRRSRPRPVAARCCHRQRGRRGSTRRAADGCCRRGRPGHGWGRCRPRTTPSARSRFWTLRQLRGARPAGRSRRPRSGHREVPSCRRRCGGPAGPAQRCCGPLRTRPAAGREGERAGGTRGGFDAVHVPDRVLRQCVVPHRQTQHAAHDRADRLGRGDAVVLLRPSHQPVDPGHRDRGRTDADAEITAETRLAAVAELWFHEVEEAVADGRRSPTTSRLYRDRLDNQIIPALGALRLREYSVHDQILHSSVEPPSDPGRFKIYLAAMRGEEVNQRWSVPW
jgi:hypothetical protein